MSRPRHLPRWFSVALPLALAVGCGDDGDATPTDAGAVADAGVAADAGAPTDAGAASDAGAPDDAGGATDAGGRPDAGYYCTMNGQETVEGQSVPVPEATETPATASASSVATRCIDRQVEPFDRRVPVCFTQCLDFLGYQPTAAEVQELEFDVFEVELPGGGTVDPSYDFVTRMERSPSRRLGVGAVARPTDVAQCPSGYQLELGYLDLGAELSSETRYVIRARSRAAASPTWATLYLWDFIRRLDEANQVGGVCSNNETRIPERGVAFPVIAAATLGQGITNTGASVTGADDLFDGQGQGYALVETRDCATSGSLVANMTVGFAPSPVVSGYVDTMGAFDGMAGDTSARGLAFALGLRSTQTSSVGGEVVRTAVGINREGACTEAFGGTTFPVFSDSVTFVRMNRETTIQPVF